MTTVYVLHEGFYYRKESNSQVLSVHLNFNYAYQELLRKSEHMSDVDDYDIYELKEIKTEQEILPGIFITGFVLRHELDKMTDMISENIYSSWAIDVFVRNTHNGTYSRILSDREQEYHYVITAKTLSY